MLLIDEVHIGVKTDCADFLAKLLLELLAFRATPDQVLEPIRPAAVLLLHQLAEVGFAPYRFWIGLQLIGLFKEFQAFSHVVLIFGQ